MSLTTYWPFLPQEQRTPEQNERWWEECYIPSPADVTLRGLPHSVVVSGGPGSGKSIALQALEKQEAGRWLTFRYPVDRWPGEPLAWAGKYQHLGQMMACASLTLKDLLTNQSHKLDRLSAINFEYLRWLIEKYSGERAFRRWADRIGRPALLNLLTQPFDDLYPTDTALPDMQGQIEELVTICQRLGFDGVIAVVDVNESQVTHEAMPEKFSNLFGRLTPLQFPGFAIKAALPEGLLARARLVERSRGRITFTALSWSGESCRQLSDRHLQAATEKKVKGLSDLGCPELITTLEKKITDLYGGPQPRAWLRLALTLLEAYLQHEQPLELVHQNDLIRTYFAHYVPLKFDRERCGVWRGVEFISLEEQPFNFLEVLWQYQGGQYANEALLRKVTSSQANLNTLANRLRKKIEPTPDHPIYLLNTRSQGYTLENVIEIASS
ncbi:MAG: hypothetical protein BroJett011_70760 [Chloroflexota bacterium]|nr:MAG: hypothetical protein BroJett011_70760 [Chloroflexota bacterium]